MYYVTKGKPILTYSNWIKENGRAERVIPIKFIGYTRFAPPGFEGQVWRCKTENGDRVIKKIKVKIHENEVKESKVEQDILYEGPNLLLDEYADFVKGKTTKANKALEAREEFEKSFFKLVRKKVAPFYPILTERYLNFMLNPSRKTLRLYHEYKDTEDFRKFVRYLQIWRERHIFMTGKFTKT